jgi:ribosomal-protein-alanine N-acetyltransferase
VRIVDALFAASFGQFLKILPLRQSQIMLEINFPSFPSLHTPRLLLREITPDDAEALFGMRSDERVMRYLARPLQQDIGEAIQLIENIRQMYTQNEALTWAICRRENPARLIGTIGFWKMDKANHRTEIGYLLHPDCWGQGLMDEAMQAAIEYCFEVLNFHSIEANTDPENAASGRVLEKHGFLQEAYFRENLCYDGRFLDSRIYSKLNPRHFISQTTQILPGG